MSDITTATSNAIQLARRRGLAEVGPDELLLGCLQALARFGIARFGAWEIDMEALGVDWLQSHSKATLPKISYSEEGVAVFDLAARIARVDGSAEIRLDHFLAAFAGYDCRVMTALKRVHGIDSASWRAAAGLLPVPMLETAAAMATESTDFLSPEQAAEALGIHVQTLRAYIRSGKLPASRIAGERSLRIRRHDLNKVLEPLVPEIQ